MSQVCGTDVRSAAGAAGPVLTHAGKELPVHDASAATVLAAAACAPVRLLGARTGSVAGTMSRLNEALSSSGYDLKIQVPSLRAGWLEWSTAVGAEAVESREEES